MCVYFLFLNVNMFFSLVFSNENIEIFNLVFDATVIWQENKLFV